MALVVTVSVLALLFAFVSQYGFGLHPCELCIYQRWPYGIAIVLAVAALVCHERDKAFLPLAVLLALTFAVNTGIAVFHVGVEQGWWQGLSGCTSDFGGVKDFDEWRRRLKEAPVARCDEVAWSLFGISMAGYNVLLCLFLALYSAAQLFRKAKT